MGIAATHASVFYREVANSEVVWGIRDSTGFPAPMYADGVRAMPFWSSESRAFHTIQNVPAYNGFTPLAIEWSTFVEGALFDVMEGSRVVATDRVLRLV